MHQRIATALLSVALLFSLGCTKNTPVTAQQRASHLISFLDKDGEPVDSCTATAIGPAAFLTASHCAEDDRIADHITIDFSVHKYQVIAATGDGRDHMIVVLAEAPFRNLAVVQADPKDLSAGEAVYIYGCGGGGFPCTLKQGKFLEGDPVSDVDQDAHLGYYTILSIAGDSGSAVYNSQNQIVAVMTYRTESVEKFLWFWHRNVHQSAGFILNFTQKTLDVARTFNPSETQDGGTNTSKQ
jgi:hypothetical protein